MYNTFIYVHAIHHRQNLNFSKLFRLEDGKSAKDLANRSEGVECQGFYTFFQSSCSTECWQIPFCLLN